MNGIADFIVQFVDFNEKLNFDFLLKAVFIYVILFWIAVSYWVYRDAKDRVEKEWVAVVIAIANFFLFFPFLILYILIRPAITDEFEEWHEGGVNIPVVNFMGKDGVEMAFELRIHPKRISRSENGEMKIDISFESNDENKVLVAPKQPEKTSLQNENKESFFVKFKESVASKLKRTENNGEDKQEVKPNNTDNQAQRTPEINENQQNDNFRFEKKKKKKKKRR